MKFPKFFTEPLVKAAPKIRAPDVGPNLNIKAPPVTGFHGAPQPSMLAAYQYVGPSGWTYDRRLTPGPEVTFKSIQNV